MPKKLRQTIKLDLPHARERHRKRCRRLGLPKDTPFGEIGARMHQRVRERRAHRADLQVGLWGLVDRAVVIAAVLSVLALFLFVGC